jgi:hypothetical protein
LTPITYSKIAYPKGTRSIVSFALSIAEEEAPIEEPMTLGATATAQLIACSTFSDSFRFGRLEMPGESMTKVLWLILQKTGDDRASSFLESLNSLCSIQYWIQTMNRILLSNSLLDDHVSATESNRALKTTILRSSFATLRAIDGESVLKTDHLHDFIAAVCHSIEISEIAIQEQAFPVVERAISLSQDRVSEDGRLLDLYNIQFAVAARFRSRLNLPVSGSFLSAYLLFAVQADYNAASSLTTLALCTICQQRSAAFYFLLTLLCIAGLGRCERRTP